MWSIYSFWIYPVSKQLQIRLSTPTPDFYDMKLHAFL